MESSAPPNRAWRAPAPARPLLRRAPSPSLAPPRTARGALTIVAGTARPRSAGEAATTSSSSSPIVSAAAAAVETNQVAPLPPAPVRTSSADSSSTMTTMRQQQQKQQRPGSAPPAPTLERAPKSEVAAGIGRRRQHLRTASPPSPSVDRALAAGAPAEEAGSSLWSAPDEFQRVTGRSDCFPVGWVERGPGADLLPPAPVRSSSSAVGPRPQPLLLPPRLTTTIGAPARSSRSSTARACSCSTGTLSRGTRRC